MTTMAPHQPDKELSALIQALEQDSDNPVLHFDLARKYFELKDFSNAFIHYEQSSLLDPTTETLVNLALTQIELGRRKEAVETASRIINRNLKSVVKDVLTNLAFIYYNDDNYEKMAQFALQGIERGTRDVLPYYYAGIAFYHIGQLDQAEDYFKKTIKIKSSYSPALYDLSCVYTKQKRIDEAVTTLRKAIIIDGSLKEIAQNDPDLVLLHEEPSFLEMINDPRIG